MSDDLRGLIADLHSAPRQALRACEGVVKKGALNIKKDWRTRASGLAHAPSYPNSIDYDVATGMNSVTAQIGPDKDKRQGALGNLIEFGSANNPPHLDGQAALDTEEPKFEKAILAAVKDFL